MPGSKVAIITLSCKIIGVVWHLFLIFILPLSPNPVSGRPLSELREIKFFDFLRKAQLRAGKKISDQHFKSNNQDKESKSQPVSFFESIENGRKEKVNKEAIWSIVASD